MANMSTHPSQSHRHRHRHRHRHPLEEVDCKGIYTCDGCKMEGIGPRYRCSKGCNYDLHHECMFAPSELTFQEKECQFHEKPPICRRRPKCTRVDYCTECRSCDACGKTVKGFVYHCSSNKEWDFHPCCAKLQSKISIDDVTFWLEKQGTYTCAWCKKKRLKGAGKNIPGWTYVSKHDDYNFHVYCVMEMAMQCSSTSSNNNNANGDSSLALVQGMKLPLKIKSKYGGTNSSNKWIKILKFFLKTVISILLGDPTAIFVSTVDHLVTQILN